MQGRVWKVRFYATCDCTCLRCCRSTRSVCRGQGVKGVRHGRAARCRRSLGRGIRTRTGALQRRKMTGSTTEHAGSVPPSPRRVSRHARARLKQHYCACLLEKQPFLRVGSTTRLSERRKGPPTPHRSLVSSRLPCPSRELVIFVTLRPSVCQLGYVVFPFNISISRNLGPRASFLLNSSFPALQLPPLSLTGSRPESQSDIGHDPNTRSKAGQPMQLP